MFSFSERGITEGLEGFFAFFLIGVGVGFFLLKGEPRLEKHQNKPLKKKKSESTPNKTSIQKRRRNVQHLIAPQPPDAIFVLPTELRRSPTNFTALKVFWVGGLGRNFRDQAHFQGI